MTGFCVFDLPCWFYRAVNGIWDTYLARYFRRQTWQQFGVGFGGVANNETVDGVQIDAQRELLSAIFVININWSKQVYTFDGAAL